MLGRFKQLQNKINNKAGYRINPYLRIRDQDAREKSWFKDLRWWIIVSGLTLRKQEWRWSGEFDLFIKFPLDLVDLNPPTRSCLAPRASHTPRFITSQDFHRLEKWLKQNKSLISQPGWMKRFHLAREISLRQCERFYKRRGTYITAPSPCVSQWGHAEPWRSDAPAVCWSVKSAGGCLWPWWIPAAPESRRSSSIRDDRSRETRRSESTNNGIINNRAVNVTDTTPKLIIRHDTLIVPDQFFMNVSIARTLSHQSFFIFSRNHCHFKF